MLKSEIKSNRWNSTLIWGRGSGQKTMINKVPSPIFLLHHMDDVFYWQAPLNIVT